jgi:hypothetical protein
LIAAGFYDVSILYQSFGVFIWHGPASNEYSLAPNNKMPIFFAAGETQGLM